MREKSYSKDKSSALISHASGKETDSKENSGD